MPVVYYSFSPPASVILLSKINILQQYFRFKRKVLMVILYREKRLETVVQKAVRSGDPLLQSSSG